MTEPSVPLIILYLGPPGVATAATVVLSSVKCSLDPVPVAVDPDNVNSYTHKTGFKLTYQDQLNYNKWLANESHQRNFAIGLKNDLNQIKDLESYFDFAVNEQCFQYNECNLLLPFVKNNKAVFGIQYKNKDFCTHAKKMNFSFVKAEVLLKGKTEKC